MRDKIAQALRDAGCADFVVERPRSLEHGDYATNAALVSNIDAHELAGTLKIEGVGKIEVVGKFINFFLSVYTVRHELQNPTVEAAYAGKKILVEYTSPNLFKPLHIGNLVGNILGESIARFLAQGGAGVVRLNYPSDIGLTVAKGVWGLWKNNLDPNDIAQLGRAYVAGNDAYESGQAKQEIEEINKALYENSHPEWSSLRTRGVETSRRHLDAICAQLGTTFDQEFFESEAAELGKDIVRAQVGGVFEQSDGAVIYRGEQDGLHTRVFLNSQGLPTYEAKEVGLFDLKSKAYPDFDISFTVTGREQAEFFKVVFAALRKLFPDKTKGKLLQQISNGFLTLTTGKMSSRKGNVITGESLIEDLTHAAKEKMQGRALRSDLGDRIAEQVAVGAIKYAVLKQGSGKDIVFDPEKSLSLEGDSGPYLQYARVRAVSLLRAAKEAGIVPGTADAPTRLGVLERTLVHFPEVVARAAAEMEPHYVTTYLTELAAAFNSWYAGEKVVGGPHPQYGVLLAGVFERAMTQGLAVLGIPAPEEM